MFAFSPQKSHSPERGSTLWHLGQIGRLLSVFGLTLRLKNLGSSNLPVRGFNIILDKLVVSSTYFGS